MEGKGDRLSSDILGGRTSTTIAMRSTSRVGARRDAIGPAVRQRGRAHADQGRHQPVSGEYLDISVSSILGPARVQAEKLTPLPHVPVAVIMRHLRSGCP
jgi:hypothetical protein